MILADVYIMVYYKNQYEVHMIPYLNWYSYSENDRSIYTYELFSYWKGD